MSFRCSKSTFPPQQQQQQHQQLIPLLDLTAIAAGKKTLANFFLTLRIEGYTKTLLLGRVGGGICKILALQTLHPNSVPCFSLLLPLKVGMDQVSASAYGRGGGGGGGAFLPSKRTYRRRDVSCQGSLGVDRRTIAIIKSREG